MSTETSPAPGFRQRLHDFFYREEVPYGLALVRIVMPLVLLVPMAPRWLHTRELYSTDGAATPLWIAYGWPNMLPEPSGLVAVILHTALIFFFLTMSAGWCTRISCIGATVLYTYLNLLDAVSTITKYSCIATHVLLLLCLSRCGAVWSIDALLRRRRDPLAAAVPQTDLAWPRRLMQLMIGLVYLGAAITKMHTPAFFSGDQMLFWMLAQLNWEHTLGEYMALVPSLIIVSAYIAIVWEVLFVFLCWRGIGRVCMISLGVLFHLMTWLTLGLFVFPLVCFTIYLCFLNESDIRRIAAAVGRVREKLGWEISWSDRASAAWQRLPVPAWSAQRSAGALAAVTLVVCTGGVAIEHLRDPYGLRQPQGPHALRELDADQVRVMLQPTKPIQQKDKVFAFDVGRTLIGGVILDRRRQFRHGDSLIAQVHMNPPYEDMWVECYLEDAEKHRISLVGHSVVAREHLRTNFMHQLNAGLAPGDYSVVLLSAGREVARRNFRLLPSVESPVAN